MIKLMIEIPSENRMELHTAYMAFFLASLIPIDAKKKQQKLENGNSNSPTSNCQMPRTQKCRIHAIDLCCMKMERIQFS